MFPPKSLNSVKFANNQFNVRCSYIPWILLRTLDYENCPKIKKYPRRLLMSMKSFLPVFEYVPMNKQTQNLFPYLWDNFGKKKRKLLSREFLLRPSLLQCRSVDLDASEYTLGLIFVTLPYGTSPASKLLTSYFWPPIIVVNIFFHFQIILTESFRGKIAPPGNFIKIYQT